MRPPLTLALSRGKRGAGTLAPSAPRAPIAASAAACWPRPTARAAPPSAAIPSIRPTSAGCAPRARRWARRWGWRRGCCTRSSTARARAGRTRSIRSPRRLQRDPGRARPRGDRLLPLGPAADRGLLRRQQAGQGLHRHAARRHQLAAVHGLLGRRPSPRLRRRRGAAVLRRSGAGRPGRAGGLQCGLVPPDPLPAHPDGARRARRARRQHRSAPHGHQRGRRPAAVAQARQRRRAVVGPAGVAGRARRDRHARSSTRTRRASRRRCGARAPSRRRIARGRRAQPASTSATSSASTTGSPAPRASSPATARASTSRRRAPTRSTPSSTATWPRAASASRAPARCRSPASPTPWAGARSAGSPTCWPRTWASRPPSATACAASGARRTSSPARASRPSHMFDAIADGRIKALWVMGTNPAVSLPRADAVRDGAGAARAAGRVGERRLQRHAWRCAHVRAAGGGLGREGRHRHQLRAAHLAPARVPAACRRGTARLVDPERRWRGGWATATPSPIAPRPTSSTSTRACRASRTAAARLRHLRPRRPRRARRSTSSSRSSGRCATAMAPTERLFADGGFFTPDRQGPLRGHRRAAPCRAPSRRLAVRAQHRPRSRPVAHHDAHGAVAAPLRRHIAEPFVEIHPDDAARLGLEQGALARVDDAARRGHRCACWSSAGSSRARCSCRSTGRPRTARARPHRRAGAAGDRPATPASPSPRRRRRASPRSPVSHYGFALSRQPLQARRPRLLGGGAQPPSATSSTSRSMRRPAAGRRGSARCCPRVTRSPSPMPAAGIYRAAVLRDGRLEAIVFVGPDAQAARRPSGSSRSSSVATIPAARAARAAGRPAGRGRRRRGADRVRLLPGGRDAHRGGGRGAGCRTVEKIGARLGAGTNCGSCVPEIRRLIAAQASRAGRARSRHEPA